MAFTAGKGYRVKIGTTEVSAYLSNVGMSLTKDALETTTFQDNSRDYIEGLKNATVTLSGRWDGAGSTAIDQVLYDAYNNSSLVTVVLNPYGISGATTFSTSQPGYSGSMIVTSYEPSAAFDGVAQFSATLQISGGISRLTSGTF